MSRLQNRVFLIGYVGIEPEFYTYPSGEKNATLRLATKHWGKDEKGEFVEETDWHTIKVYGRLTEVVENYVHKGKQIAIEGRISYKAYNATEGSKRYFTEIICNELQLLGGGHGSLKPFVAESYETSK